MEQNHTTLVVAALLTIAEMILCVPGPNSNYDTLTDDQAGQRTWETFMAHVRRIDDTGLCEQREKDE